MKTHDFTDNKKIMKNKTTKCRGSVLVFTIIIMGMMMATAMSLITVASIERKTSGATGKSTASFQAADTGIEMVLARINDPLNTMIEDVLGSWSCSGGQIKDSGNGFAVTLYDRADSPVEILCDDYENKRIGEIGRIKSVGSKSQTVRAVQVDIPGDVLDESLVGHWKFDEIVPCDSLCAGSGTTPNSRGSNDGELINLDSSDQTEREGMPENKVFDFDGSTEYVSVADHSSINLSGSMTVSMWINASVLADWASPLGKVDNDGYNFNGYGFFYKNGTMRFFTSNETRFSKKVFTETNSWHHLVGTYDGTNVLIYIDGVAGTPYGTTLITTNNEPLNIGRMTTGVGYFNGKIDDVRIYDRALTGREVKRIFNATK